MPSPEEIIKQLRDNSSTKPSQQVNQEVLELQSLMRESDPQKASQKAYNLLMTSNNAEVGVAVCQALLERKDGVQIATEIGKQTAKESVGGLQMSSLDSFLRTNSPVTAFSRQFIAQNSPDYVQDTKQRADALWKQLKVDELDQATPEQRKDAMIKLTSGMKNILATPKLSDESQQYLKGLYDGVMENPGFQQRYMDSGKHSKEEAQRRQEELGEIVINNSSVLRFGGEALNKFNPDDVYSNDVAQKNKYWTSALNFAQKSVSLNNKVELSDRGGKQVYDLVNGAGNKETNQEVIGKFNKEMLGEFHNTTDRDTYKSMLTSVKTTGAAKSLGVDLAEGMKAIQPYNDRIDQLQARKTQLATKPTAGDHIKAFFKHGFKGVQGEIDRVDKQIAATVQAKIEVQSGMSMEESQKNLERLKHNKAVVFVEKEKAGMVVRQDNAEKSLNMKPTFSEEQVDKSLKHHDALDGAKAELTAQIKTQEKVLKVREMMQPKTQEQAQGHKNVVKTGKL